MHQEHHSGWICFTGTRRLQCPLREGGREERREGRREGMDRDMEVRMDEEALFLQLSYISIFFFFFHLSASQC